MSSFNNDLRLKEIATGAESGTWGTSTNTNMSLIAEAFSYGTEAITTNADTHTTTIADASSDPGRSLYLKYTGTLDSACTITLAPNTVSKVWFIENATSGSQNIIISQGSGSNVTIPNGSVMAVYSDGGGGSANIVSVLTDVVLTDSVKITGTTPTLTLGDGDAEDAKILFDGNAKDFHIGLDDSADDLVFGLGSALGTTKMFSLDGADTGGEVTIGGTRTGIGASTLHAAKAAGGNIISLYSEASTALVCADTDNGDPVAFGADSSTNFTVRLGTSATERFTVLNSGNISILTDGQGILMKSPNGTGYKVTVSNAGALVVTAV